MTCSARPEAQRQQQQPYQEPDGEPSAAADALEVQPLCVESSPEALGSPSSSWHTREKPFWKRLANDRTWVIIRAASAVAPFWFLAQLCFNTALHLTSVTSNTILSSPSSLFTYMLSIAVLREKFTYCKLTGVLLTVIGAQSRTGIRSAL